MRPIKLTMSAFESYKDKTEIDFENFGKQGLYLISGVTGSGKTSIFDAITFALYDTPSGVDRNKEMLRSDFASPDELTYVELEFESNGKRYLVNRNPSYKRKSKKQDDKEVEEKASARLEYLSDDKKPIESLREVNEEIKKIIGLDRDKFCSIAMLAQGKFYETLVAKTEDKKELFRMLFKTEKFNKLESNLKDKARDKNAEYTKLNNEVSQLLDEIEIDCDYMEINQANLEKFKNIIQVKNISDSDETILKNFLTAHENKIQKMNNEINKLSEKKIKLSEEISKQEERKKIILEKEKKEKELEELLQKEKELQNEFTSVKENAEIIPQLQIEVSEIEKSFDEYKKLSDKKLLIEDLKKQIKVLEKNITDNKNLLEKCNDKYELIKNQIEQLKDCEVTLLKKENEQNQIQIQSEKVCELINLFKERFSITKEIGIIEIEVKSFSDKEKGLSEDFKSKKEIYYSDLTGTLLEKLKEGMPCPLCGSLHHPNPAVKSLNSISKSEIEEFENSLNNIKDKLQNKVLELTAKITSLESINKQILDFKTEFTNIDLEKDDADQKLKDNQLEIQKHSDSISIEIVTLKKSCQKKNELEKEFLQVEEQKNQVAPVIIKDESDYKNLKVKLEYELQISDTIQNQLKFETLEAAENNYSILSKKIMNLKNILEDVQNKLTDCQNRVVNCRYSINEFDKQILTIKEEDYEKLFAEIDELEIQLLDLQKLRDKLNQIFGKNKHCIENILKYNPELKKVSKELEMIRQLESVVSGKNLLSQNDKISLETYVQMIFLDHITYKANLRLRKMSNNQYELRRKTNDLGAKSQGGLELNVKDFYTGRERQVQSMSGGEQFQASLALALGFADEVQSSSGGIKLDSLFIDEGFGTLDPESLSKAMKILEELTNGNKLVGIISHVESLKERIPNKISVTKNPDGISSVKIFCEN